MSVSGVLDTSAGGGVGFVITTGFELDWIYDQWETYGHACEGCSKPG